MTPAIPRYSQRFELRLKILPGTNMEVEKVLSEDPEINSKQGVFHFHVRQTYPQHPSQDPQDQVLLLSHHVTLPRHHRRVQRAIPKVILQVHILSWRSRESSQLVGCNVVCPVIQWFGNESRAFNLASLATKPLTQFRQATARWASNSCTTGKWPCIFLWPDWPVNSKGFNIFQPSSPQKCSDSSGCPKNSTRGPG